jgi:hypothetical protein
MAFKQLSLTKFVKPISEEEKYLALERTALKLVEEKEVACQHTALVKPKNPVDRPC